MPCACCARVVCCTLLCSTACAPSHTSGSAQLCVRESVCGVCVHACVHACVPELCLCVLQRVCVRAFQCRILDSADENEHK